MRTGSSMPVALLLLIACSGSPRAESDSTATSAAPDSVAPVTSNADSLCGTVRVVGSEPDVMVQLELTSTARAPLVGEPTRSLRLLSGLGVCVLGTATVTGERSVSSFVVRSQEGEPAVDGTLVERDAAFFVRTSNGDEVRLATIPDPMRREVGSRIWVVLDSGYRVKSMGVIR